MILSERTKLKHIALESEMEGRKEGARVCGSEEKLVLERNWCWSEKRSWRGGGGEKIGEQS